MIFFSVWLRGYSREVLRESFDCPITSTTIGILGILGILGSQTLWVGAFGWLTSSDALSNPHEPASQKLQPSQPPAPPNASGLTSAPPSSGQSQPRSSPQPTHKTGKYMQKR